MNNEIKKHICKSQKTAHAQKSSRLFPPIKKQLTTFTNTPAQTKNSEQACLGLLHKKESGTISQKKSD